MAGEEIEDGAHARGKRAALAEIDGVNLLEIARIEVFQNRHEAPGADVFPYGELRKPCQPGAGKRQLAQPLAIAHLYRSEAGSTTVSPSVLNGQPSTARA